MDLFEKINRSFGSWYEGLFGGGDDVRPKDILRRILAAMEDNRKEGFDNKVYVPNQYILEINVHDEEEKEYLLSFLDRDELEAAIRRYCQQNHYSIRGPLDFTIKEVEDSELSQGRQEKVRVRCRYNTKVTAPEPAPSRQAPSAASAAAALPDIPTEERTVPGISAYGAGGEESGTVPSIASAALVVYAPDRPPFRYTIARGAVNIGRSQRVGNDLVIDSDGQVSKRHARIELDPDGKFTVYDLGSTNGTKVNGRRVDNRTLHDGDEITLGATRLVFQQAQREEADLSEEEPVRREPARDKRAPEAQLAPPGAFGGAAARIGGSEGSSGAGPVSRVLRSHAARLVLTDGPQEVDDFLLASETFIGRGITNDIVLPDRSIATQHARIAHDGDGYTLERLGGSETVTTLNAAPLSPGQPTPLKDGDRIGLGNLTLRFESGI
ncbi:MAG TPA: FhaA domain-containing protein [Chthonomonadaceae bacterium]|nr:FhaA domain-containing protein [Chthonomonadaceae bacterium]